MERKILHVALPSRERPGLLWRVQGGTGPGSTQNEAFPGVSTPVQKPGAPPVLMEFLSLLSLVKEAWGTISSPLAESF